MGCEDMTKIYTGRKIAIFTDAHGLLEPVEAALRDIASRGVSEIYSLGDNICDGPDSLGVVKLLSENGVKSVAGNAEEYIRIGVEPFRSYIESGSYREKEVDKTRKQLGEEGIKIIEKYLHTYEVELGGKQIGLCHFGNDVRIDFDKRSTWSYQYGFDYFVTGKRYDKDISRQFAYTASQEQIDLIRKYGSGDMSKNPENGGFVSAYNEPMFPTGTLGVGKNLNVFDDVFQGHVHFKLEDPTKETNFHTLRAVGMGYRNDPIDSASYVLLSEYEDPDTSEKEFDIEEILVTYDREKMVYKVLNSYGPYSRIAKFISVTEEEKSKFSK